MPINSSAVAVVGPNGVGKTAVAYELARDKGGEVVNLDTVYLFRGFALITGLADTLAEEDVPRHLYQLLEPAETLPAPATYAALVRHSCAEIASRGRLPVIEGGSTTYFPALEVENRADPFCTVFALRFAGDPRQAIEARIDRALGQGLLAEVARSLQDHPHSWVMRQAHFAVPLVRHLQGELELAAAKELIVADCLAYAERQMQMLEAYPELIWLEHDKANPARTAERIAAHLAQLP